MPVQQRVGPYDVEGELGRGGMGVVYAARDQRLDRRVALKALPETVAKDAERLARFEREAKVLASLSHPNIAAIHGIEDSDGSRFLVLEFVEGEDLSRRIARGPIPIDEAIDIARQVAEALEAAHERGVVHRDLKPGNIKVTPEGKIKVLDFGLAKAVSGDGPAASSMDSPTITAEYTRPGLVLGTAGYMSPEQARGRGVDKRSDIWAFGCVLYECLTGRMAFAGETVTDSLGAILHKEPDWAALPLETPATVRLLLRRCLAKDRNKRLRDIGDARVELDEAGADPSTSALRLASGALKEAVAAERRSALRRSAPWLLVGVLALAGGALGWIAWSATRPQPKPILSLLADVAGNDGFAGAPGSPIALSPDGTLLAYVVAASDGRHLWVRKLGEQEGVMLSGTEEAMSPFFSPDGQWIAFFTVNKLKKVSVSGGAAMTLCDVTNNSRGGTWGDDGSIVFAPTTRSGLMRVAESGGTPEPMTTLGQSEKAKETSHRWPQALPGGRGLIFTSRSSTAGDFNNTDLCVYSHQTKTATILHHGGSYARYVPSGHLVFVREATIFAAPMDLDGLRLTSAPVPLREGVMFQPSTGAAKLAFSESGTLVYQPGTDTSSVSTVAWIDRAGALTPILAQEDMYQSPALSPDGTRLALQKGEILAADVWVYDLARQAMTRLTFGASTDGRPLWMPDGTRIVFYSEADHEPVWNVYWKPADGTGEAERLTTGENNHTPSSISPDGRVLLFDESNPVSGFDIMKMSLDGERKTEPFLMTPSDERYGQVSPDGKWVAYASAESGRWDVFVRPLSGGGGRWQVNTTGMGVYPKWSADGRELFYTQEDFMMSAAVTVEGSTLKIDTPRQLFTWKRGGWPGWAPFDVSPDGQRFVALVRRDDASDQMRGRAMFVLNWFEELEQKAPLSRQR